MNPKEKIILIGAGGHCVSCIDVIEQENKFEIVGIVDDNKDVWGTSILGYKVLGGGDQLKEIADAQACFNFHITIGQIKTNQYRKKYFDAVKSIGGSLPVIYSPYSHVSTHSQLGEGTIVMHGVIVNAQVNVGGMCILNTNCLIEHDSKVGSGCHISTAAVINGTVQVGENCFIGSNSTLVNNISIADNTIVGAGSLVHRSIDKSNGTWVGNPAICVST